MTDQELDQNIKEAEEAYARIQKAEDEAVKNIAKHFDRINDKLFTFNNIMIAGFFALSKIENSHTLSIIVPILNMILLIYIEYRMMEANRFQADITRKSPASIDKWRKNQNTTNGYAFVPILTTISVAVYFMVLLVKK